MYPRGELTLAGIVRIEMKPSVSRAVVRKGSIALAFAAVVGVVIIVVGRVNGWSTSLPYSNAFFVAGVLIAGGGFADRIYVPRDMKRGSSNLAVICLLSGTFLILASVLISKLF